jgi:hypothetical protein
MCGLVKWVHIVEWSGETSSRPAPVSAKSVNNARKITGIGLIEHPNLAKRQGASVNLPRVGNERTGT